MLAMGSTTIRWAAPSILVGGVLYALYGPLNPFLGVTALGVALGNLPGTVLLAVGVAGLNSYLHQRGVPLGRVGQAGLYICMVTLAIWAALGVAIIVGLALFGMTALLIRMFGVIDGVLVVLFVGSVLFGAALWLRTNVVVVPRGAALLLVVASVLALVPALAGYVLEIRIWVFEVLRVPYGAAWAWLGYGLWAARGETAQQQARVR
jgi:hypothetical protein